MKKLFALLFSLTLLLVAGFKAEAQQTLRQMTSDYGLAYDTATNTGTAELTIHNPGAKSNTSFFIEVDKLTGTIGESASLKVQVSHDGTNWQDLNQYGTQTAVVAVTVADTDKWYNITLLNNPGNYYKILLTGNGTMTARFRAWCLSR